MHFSSPIKILSKNLSSTRAMRLRASWFALGIAFGIGCSTSLSPIGMAQASLQEWEQNESTMHAANLPYNTTKIDPAITTAAPLSTVTEAEVAAAEPEVPELAAVVTPVTVEIEYPITQDLVVASGDTFVTLLGKVGVSSNETHALLSAMGSKFNPRSLGVSDMVNVTLDKKPNAENPHIEKLSMALSPAKTLKIERDNKGNFKVDEINAPLVKKLARAGGKIQSSLYGTLIANGLPSSMLGEIIKAYSYDVDFQRDIHAGDKIDVVFERIQTEDGKPVSFGKVVYASLNLRGKDVNIYRYTDKTGSTDFYNAKGESVRKGLLRTPMNGARISSGFGARRHPILGYTKMHKGVDFAAPIGTPIYASGDGVVNFVGRKGGYGNYLAIKHNNTYTSAYAHLSRFASGVAPGKKVKQGQIIAYVGNTGMSTGPHLHYEIHANGVQVNPSNVKFKTGTMLAGKELKAFKRERETLQAQLNAMGKPSGKIAMLETPAKKSAN